MQLTSYTDYSLRTLLFLASHSDRLITISEIAAYHHISRNHLVKVVHNLSLNGYIHTIRGKSGGMRLKKNAQDIILADVVRLTEPHMHIQECFSQENNTCPLIKNCKLKGILYQARQSFMNVLEKQTLADVL